jgi:hypothetical protein
MSFPVRRMCNAKEEACGSRVSCVRYVKGIILALQSCKDERERETPMIRIQAVPLSAESAAPARNAMSTSKELRTAKPRDAYLL